PEASAGLLSRLSMKRAKTAHAAASHAAAPVKSMRRRLLVAGLVLLAVVSAVAVGSRELPLGKLKLMPDVPPVTAPPSTTPRQAEREPRPDRRGKTTANEVMDAFATASVWGVAGSEQHTAPAGISATLWKAASAGDRTAQFVVASKFLEGREVGRD